MQSDTSKLYVLVNKYIQKQSERGSATNMDKFVKLCIFADFLKKNDKMPLLELIKKAENEFPEFLPILKKQEEFFADQSEEGDIKKLEDELEKL